MAALARELAKRHEVTVLTSRARHLTTHSEDAGVRVLRVPVFFRKHLAVANFPSMLAYLPAAVLRGALLGRRAFDIVNTHFVVPTGPAGALLASYYGVPNILSVHGGDLFDPSKKSSPHRHRWLRAPIRHLLKSADAVVGQSRNTVGHVESIFDVRRDVDLIPLGIERPPRAEPSLRAALGLPEGAHVLVTVGRLVPRKATPQLVQALHASSRSAHLLIVGEGPDAQATREIAERLGISGRVHCLGQATEAQKWQALASADVFVSTTQHEGFGLVFLEAMAFGLPIICYDHGGQTDFLTDRQTGRVLHLNDVSGFARAIAEVLDDAGARHAMGENNRRLVENFFIDRCAERYEAVFERAIAQRGAIALRGTH